MISPQIKKAYLVMFFIFLIPIMVVAQEDSAKSIESEDVVNTVDTLEESAVPNDLFVITYYHGTRRCATCKKLEAYSSEAVKNEFPEELKEGKVVWQTLNFDKEANEHVKKDYGLFSQAVVISHVVDGKEIEWINLKKIWDYVGNKEKFLKYIQTEANNFMNPKKNK